VSADAEIIERRGSARRNRHMDPSTTVCPIPMRGNAHLAVRLTVLPLAFVALAVGPRKDTPPDGAPVLELWQQTSR